MQRTILQTSRGIFSTGEVEVAGSTIYHKTEYRERRNHYAVYSVNHPVNGFDTSRDAFIGLYNSPADPQAVRKGFCSGSIAHGWAPVASHHIHLKLRPGDSVSLVFVLGYCENPKDKKFSAPGVINKEPADRLLARYQTTEQVMAAFQELKDYWTTLLSAYTIQTEDVRLNRMVNIWNQYQCMVTFNMSRSASYYESGLGRGMGFRDSCQDLLGFCPSDPGTRPPAYPGYCSYAISDGSAYHQYQPLTKQGNLDIGSGFNDDPLWLIAGTAAYLRETGDFSILEEPCTFDNDADNTAPLMEHLRRSFQYTATHKRSSRTATHRTC